MSSTLSLISLDQHKYRLFLQAMKEVSHDHPF